MLAVVPNRGGGCASIRSRSSSWSSRRRSSRRPSNRPRAPPPPPRRLFPLSPRVAPVLGRGAALTAVLAVLTVLAGGTAYAALEDEPHSWDGIWWAVSTMTTVGYGDQYPVTVEGRVLAIIVMLVGIGFVSMLVGAVSEQFVARELATESRRSSATSTRRPQRCCLSCAPCAADSTRSRRRCGAPGRCWPLLARRSCHHLSCG